MSKIDETLAKLQQVEILEKKLKDSKNKLRAELAKDIDELPDRVYSNKLAKVTFVKGRLSRKVKYDQLLGYLGKKKYAEFITESTGKESLKVTWNE